MIKNSQLMKDSPIGQTDKNMRIVDRATTYFAVAMLVNKLKEIANIFSFEFYSNTFLSI